MKIFVTGGTGFIGSHFINQATREGHDITALRRSENGSAIPLEQEPVWLTKPLEELSKEDFEGLDAVVHLAATGVSPQPADWSSCFEFNVIQSLRLMKLSQESGVDRFIAAGTYSEYGNSGLRYDFIPSDAPLEPTDPYAASKAAASIALSSFARKEGTKLYYGRIFSAYGEGQFEKNFWPALRYAALNGEDFSMTLGEQVRDFISVETVAEVFLKACNEYKLIEGDPIVRNVASGEPVTLASIAKKWWNEWGAKGNLNIGGVPYREHEVMRYIPMIEEVDA